MEEAKVVVITGITGSVGKGILLGLLSRFDNIKIYGTARDAKRVVSLYNEIIERLPKKITELIGSGSIQLLPLSLDTGKLETVTAACKLLKEENKKIDTLFLNAGTIVSNGISYNKAIYQLFFNLSDFPVRPNYILHDGKTRVKEDLTLSFCTNVYGHYIMANKLSTLLQQSKDARIIWTGSSEGERTFFDIDDFQGINSINVYGSNKYCLHLVSEVLNRRFKKDGLPIVSVIAQPGVVVSNIASSLIHPIIVMIFMTPILLLLRFLLSIPELTLTIDNGATSMMHVLDLPLENINLIDRYDSMVDKFGNPYVAVTPISPYTENEVEQLEKNLKDLEKYLN